MFLLGNPKNRRCLVSFHPAGHILGSAQIRVEVKGRVWVVSGDYKPQPDRSCEPFQLVKCNVFVSECTFGLPVYHWEKEEPFISRSISGGATMPKRVSPVCCLPIPWGRLSGSCGDWILRLVPSMPTGQFIPFCPFMNHPGSNFPVQKPKDGDGNWSGAMIVAPPAVEDAGWTRRFKGAERGFAWVDGGACAKRRRNLDRGFILSDHADWAGLLEVIKGQVPSKLNLRMEMVLPWRGTWGTGHSRIDAGRCVSANRGRITYAGIC